jgi:DNA polymerase III alpha subunit
MRYNLNTMLTRPRTIRFSPLLHAATLLVLLLTGFSASSLLETPAVASSLTEIADLLAHPEQYDHQDVVVAGKVTNVQLATNRQGQPAYGFLLQDQAGTLKVVSLGQLEVREGDFVIVEGVFSRLRQVGRVIVYNEIKALSVKPLNRLDPDLVG